MTEKTKRHPFHWQYLRPWFRPVWMKLLIPWFAIIPLLLSIFEGVPRTIALPLGQEVVLNIYLPFKWWLLWGASVLYAFAFTIYAIWCPKFIRLYPSYHSYQSLGHSPRWMAGELNYAVERSLSKPLRERLFERLISKRLATKTARGAEDGENPEVSERGTSYRFEFKGDTYEFLGSEKDADAIQKDREVFWEILGRLAGSNGFARAVVWTLLGGAGLLLVWAVGQNLAVAFGYLTSELFN